MNKSVKAVQLIFVIIFFAILGYVMYLLVREVDENIEPTEVVETPVEVIDKTNTIVIEQNVKIYIDSIERFILLNNSTFSSNKKDGKYIYTKDELINIYDLYTSDEIDDAKVKLISSGDVSSACIYTDETYILYSDNTINYTLHNQSCMEEVN